MFSKIYDRIKPLIRVALIGFLVLGIITKSLVFVLLIMYTAALQLLCFSIVELQNRKKGLFFLYFAIGVIVIVYSTSKFLSV